MQEQIGPRRGCCRPIPRSVPLRDSPRTTIERLPTSATACPRLGTARRELLAAPRTLPRQDDSAQPGAAVTPVTGGGAVISQPPAKPARTATLAALPAPGATRAAFYIATQIAMVNSR